MGLGILMLCNEKGKTSNQVSKVAGATLEMVSTFYEP